MFLSSFTFRLLSSSLWTNIIIQELREILLNPCFTCIYLVDDAPRAQLFSSTANL